MKIIITLLSITAVALAAFFLLPDRKTMGEGGVAYESDLQYSGTYAFTNVHIMPMTEDGLILENHTVIIKDGIITTITDTDKIKFTADTEIIDGTGKYLIPGLAGMQGDEPSTHPSPITPSYLADEYMEHMLSLYNIAGITTVRTDFGTIEDGKKTDLILVNGNPLEDATNIQNYSGLLVKEGWLSREMIDEKLKETERSN